MKRDIVTSAIGDRRSDPAAAAIVYPLAVTGISQVAFPGNANGQQLEVGGKLVGSKIIGQHSPTSSSSTASRRWTRTATPVTSPDPQLLPEPTLGDRPADNAAGSDVLEPRPEQRRDRAGDRQQHPGVHRAREAVRPRADRRAGPGRRGRQLGVRASTRTSRSRTRTSRRTAIASVRHLSLSQVDELISKYTDGRGLGFSASRASTCSSSTSRSTASAPEAMMTDDNAKDHRPLSAERSRCSAATSSAAR